jgi:hypothetical protein
MSSSTTHTPIPHSLFPTPLGPDPQGLTPIYPFRAGLFLGAGGDAGTAEVSGMS